MHSTLYSAKLYSSYFTLQILRFTLTLRTPQSTLYARSVRHSTIYLYTRHSHANLYALPLYTLNFTLDSHNFALFTVDTVWNLGLAPLSCCLRTSTCRPALSLLTVTLLPTLPDIDSAEGGPWNFPLHGALCTPHLTLHTLGLSFLSHFTPHTPHYFYTWHSHLRLSSVFHAHHPAKLAFLPYP